MSNSTFDITSHLILPHLRILSSPIVFVFSLLSPITNNYLITIFTSISSRPNIFSQVNKMNHPRQFPRMSQQWTSTGKQPEEPQQQSLLPNQGQARRTGTKRRHAANDNQSCQVTTRKHQKHIPQSMRISNLTNQSNEDHVICQISFT
jgi:hypothetical protein